jgi:hypothetical protein
MKRTLIFILGNIAALSCAFAQQGPGTMTSGGVSIALSARSNPVTGAPYSATISNESVQTLADGNRIVQNFTGTMARDSQGRTRQDASLPAIGNLSAEKDPHIVFIMDPVAQVTYTLNLTEKTAQKMPMPPAGAGPDVATAMGVKVMRSAVGNVTTGGAINAGSSATTSAMPPPGTGDAVYIQMADGVPAGGPMPPPMAFQKMLVTNDPSGVKTEDLGTQTMEGLLVSGTRTTHTIAAGQIGNEQPITTVTEVWTSPDLKTIVSSKRSDPRMGEQTFQLTNITRGEPDASLFTVPPDFKIIDGPQKIMYGVNK